MKVCFKLNMLAFPFMIYYQNFIMKACNFEEEVFSSLSSRVSSCLWLFASNWEAYAESKSQEILFSFYKCPAREYQSSRFPSLSPETPSPLSSGQKLPENVAKNIRHLGDDWPFQPPVFWLTDFSTHTPFTDKLWRTWMASQSSTEYWKGHCDLAYNHRIENAWQVIIRLNSHNKGCGKDGIWLQLK